MASCSRISLLERFVVMVISLVAFLAVFHSRSTVFQQPNNHHSSVMFYETNHCATPAQQQQQPQHLRALRSLMISETQHELSDVPHQHYHRYLIPTTTRNNNNNNNLLLFQNDRPESQQESEKVVKIQTIEIPIIIQLSGEFGNHLSKIAAGIGVAAMIHSYNNKDNDDRQYRFTTNLHIRHQDHTTKGDTAMQILQNCFPNLIHVQDENDLDINATALLLQQHIPSATTITQKHNPYSNINSHHAMEVDTTIQRIIKDAMYAYETRTTVSQNKTITTTTSNEPLFVYSNHLVGYFDVYMDRFYNLYRQYFIMNETNPMCGCCINAAANDGSHTNEIVFYYRGYQIEMPKKGMQLGYEEIHPNTLVSYLEGTLDRSEEQPPYGDMLPHKSDRPQQQKQIAIVSRFPNHTQPYVDALTDAGYTVRVVQHAIASNSSKGNNVITSILHDFCLLRRTTKQLIGPIRSTYFMWASILAVRNYNYTDTNRRNRRTPSSVLHVTAYTTESQLLWAKHQQPSSNTTTTTGSNTAVMDSIAPTSYYCRQNNINNNGTNYTYQSLWTDRHFHFPIVT